MLYKKKKHVNVIPGSNAGRKRLTAWDVKCEEDS